MNLSDSLILILVLVLAVTVIIALFFRTKDGTKFYSSKTIQLIVGLLAAVSPFFVSSSNLIIYSGSTVILILIINVTNSSKLKNNNFKMAWNSFHFLFAYFILAILMLPDQKEIFFLSFALFIIGDCLASLADKIYPRVKLTGWQSDRSLAGSIIFFISALIILLLPIRNLLAFQLPDWNLTYTNIINPIGYVIVISLILTVIDGFSSGKIKIYTLLIIASFLIYTFVNSNSQTLLTQLLVGFLLAGIISAFSFTVKFLTLSGAIATFLLAGFLFSFGQIKWSVPILTFFILSSLLSKYRKKVRSEVEDYFEKSGVRDHWQVFANGGLGGLLVMANSIMPHEVFYYMYIATLSAVCADTWATEIGTLKKTPTYNILTFRPITQGMSGGISLVGTLGGLLGAIVISLSGIFWIHENYVLYVPIIVFSGIIGSLFDSVLGASVQAQFHCNTCGKITEKTKHCSKASEYHRGFAWMNNDVVNLFAGFTGLLAVYLFYNIM